MDDGVLDRRPLTLAELAGHLASGCKPKSDFRVGSEHEKFLFRPGSNAPVAYGPDAEGHGGVQALLEGLMPFGWSGVYEDGPNGHVLIALTRGEIGRAHV
jgi:glutamate--cysteine ligase